jgi:DNA primase
MKIPHIHEDTIEEIKQRIDIIDIVSDYVVLKKRGQNYQGLCPFHQEKTPSFTVNPTKQFYHCFGCNAGGNGIKFLMELEKKSFQEVILELAQRYQIPIKTAEAKDHQEIQRQLSIKEQLYEILAVTASFYQYALYQDQGEKVLNYLRQERQLQEATIQQFEFGYAPAGWETLYHYLVEVKRYPLALVEQAGLIKKRQSGNGYYDQFRDRLMIPIHDIRGRIIAFGSRTLTDEQPKYLNSPETPLFDKSKTLFALDKARQSISQQDQAVVVEGYFDAIALHAAKINNVVASLGTAFTQQQIKLLLRYTESKQIVLNFDADSAGNQATQRTIAEVESLVYGGQIQLKVLHLPDGKDADEFLKSDPHAVKIYQELLENAPLWLNWQLDQLIIAKDLKQGDQFQTIVQEMLKLLRKIDEPNQRNHYLSYCAGILGQNDSRLIPLYANSLASQLRKSSSSDQKVSLPTGSESSLLKNAEEILLLIYLHCPQYRLEIVTYLEEKDLLFSFSHHRFLWQKIIAFHEQNQQKTTDFTNQLFTEIQNQLTEFPPQMKQLNHLFHLTETQIRIIERADLYITSAIASMERVTCEKYRRYCLEKWQNLDPGIDRETRQYYFQELYEVEQKIKQLDQVRNTSLTQNSPSR